MLTDRIEALGIDDNGSLWLKPCHARFPHIYRAAAGIAWDEEQQRLYSPAPREWSYFDWFKRIHQAVIQEYDTDLFVDEESSWSNIDDGLRLAILALFKEPK